MTVEELREAVREFIDEYGIEWVREAVEEARRA